MADTDFDVEPLRHSYESISEWKLRKAFLLEHYDKLDMDRLLCLASCYINVECYGCRYPDGVMSQLKDMMEELGEEHKEHRAAVKAQNEVKFVKASENTRAGGARPAKKTGMTFVSATKGYQSTDCTEQNKSADSKPSLISQGIKNNSSQILKQTSKCCTDTGKYKQHEAKFDEMSELLKSTTAAADMNVVSLVYLISRKAGVSVQCNFSTVQGGFQCEICLDTIFISCGNATNKKEAKLNAFVECKKVISNPERHVCDADPKKVELAGSRLSGNISIKSSSNRNNSYSPKIACSKPEMSRLSRKRKAPSKPDHSQCLVIKRAYLKEQNNSVLLNETAGFNQMTIDYDFRIEGENHVCTVSLDSIPLAEGSASKALDAKELAAADAIKVLEKKYWTLIIKRIVDSADDNLTREAVFGDQDKTSQAIPQSNIGNKLLQKMGWSGGGVGADGNKGIAEPIAVSSVLRRQGLGLGTEMFQAKDFLPKIREVLHAYTASEQEGDLALSPDFTKEERAVIHMESKKLGLKSHSHGSGSNRHLVLSRKRNKVQLFNYINKQGGETEKYKLIPPGSNINWPTKTIPVIER